MFRHPFPPPPIMQKLFSNANPNILLIFLNRKLIRSLFRRRLNLILTSCPSRRTRHAIEGIVKIAIKIFSVAGMKKENPF